MAESESFIWTEYLKKTGNKPADWKCFKQHRRPLQNLFAIDCLLEAVDQRSVVLGSSTPPLPAVEGLALRGSRQQLPAGSRSHSLGMTRRFRGRTAFSLARVIERCGPRLRVRFVGTDDRNDCWFLVDSGQIRCYPSGQELLPPFGYIYNHLIWSRTLKRATESHKFAESAWFIPPPTGPSENLFKVGDKIEAVDRHNAQLICPATISAISGPRVLVTFDGWSGTFDYWTQFDSRDIFPVGWCRLAGHILQSPGPQAIHHLNLATGLPKGSSLKRPRKSVRQRHPVSVVSSSRNRLSLSRQLTNKKTPTTHCDTTRRLDKTPNSSPNPSIVCNTSSHQTLEPEKCNLFGRRPSGCMTLEDVAAHVSQSDTGSRVLSVSLGSRNMSPNQMFCAKPTPSSEKVWLPSLSSPFSSLPTNEVVSQLTTVPAFSEGQPLFDEPVVTPSMSHRVLQDERQRRRAKRQKHLKSRHSFSERSDDLGPEHRFLPSHPAPATALVAPAKLMSHPQNGHSSSEKHFNADLLQPLPAVHVPATEELIAPVQIPSSEVLPAIPSVASTACLHNTSSDGPLVGAETAAFAYTSSTVSHTTLATGSYLLTNPINWSIGDVYHYLISKDSSLKDVAATFKHHEIDGQALMLLNIETMRSYMKLKLGPSLKLDYLIGRLRKGFN